MQELMLRSREQVVLSGLDEARRYGIEPETEPGEIVTLHGVPYKVVRVEFKATLVPATSTEVADDLNGQWDTLKRIVRGAVMVVMLLSLCGQARGQITDRDRDLVDKLSRPQAMGAVQARFGSPSPEEQKRLKASTVEFDKQPVHGWKAICPPGSRTYRAFSGTLVKSDSMKVYVKLKADGVVVPLFRNQLSPADKNLVARLEKKQKKN
jgi:hypothetical protein